MPAPEPEPESALVVMLGGTVQVRCVGPSATVVSVSPNPGYQVERYAPGPAPQVQVVLGSATDRSQMRAKCVDGRPKSEVRESQR